ncbi:hypothetical protein Kpol_363p6 [Vanderwaltozyma polyspora DSM 70294]|uniref:Derlin n=1 Tax=Vanderwaltozyma polyspora (strain ATCC 22028 / DSM 70294 / BCRC 21397 / CBS 2163 / NBRC 10782 / NRRL Y-8283 / UCD 57-17) TaxID=436907 RepID=A7TS89_VANPO|nr:uncharacterized protein Kpol_363p6 [Vanderwaltozyma polyspora DSM 70294]EDO14866.1 hypothetical protein Kpol_363p6 [Vanderwaltozyma polyspora DSM 70294]
MNSNKNINNPNTAAGSSWFTNIPPITRYLLTAIVTIIGLWKLSIIGLDKFVYSWYDVVKRFQFWRIFTSCIIIIPGTATQALATILEFYNLYSRSSHLETVHFRGDKAHYAYYILCCMIIIAISCSAWFRSSKEQFILQSAFTSCIGYTWAMDHPESQILYYGVLPIKGKYYPVMEMIISFVFNAGENAFQLCVIGVCTGYFFQCLDTNSFGPLSWWLFTNKNASEYSIGSFKPPRWFISLFSNLDGTRINTFSGRGSRLGNGSNKPGKAGTPYNPRLAILNSKDNNNDSQNSFSARDFFGTSAEKRKFPGKGQKLGK